MLNSSAYAGFPPFALPGQLSAAVCLVAFLQQVKTKLGLRSVSDWAMENIPLLCSNRCVCLDECDFTLTLSGWKLFHRPLKEETVTFVLR